MMNDMMNGTFQDKCAMLRALQAEVESTRNELVWNLVQKMEIDKAYTIQDLRQMEGGHMSIERLSGAFHSLATIPMSSADEFGRRARRSSLRSKYAYGKIVKGETCTKQSFYIECDENGVVLPNARMSVSTTQCATYIRKF